MNGSFVETIIGNCIVIYFDYFIMIMVFLKNIIKKPQI